MKHRLDLDQGIGKLLKSGPKKKFLATMTSRELLPAEVDEDVIRELEKIITYCRAVGKSSGTFTFKRIAEMCGLKAFMLQIFIQQGDSKKAIAEAYFLGRCYERIKSSEVNRVQRKLRIGSLPEFIKSIQGWKTKSAGHLLMLAKKQFPDRDQINLMTQIRRVKKSRR